MTTTHMNHDIACIGVSAHNRILQSVLAALNEGNISNAVDQFDDHPRLHTRSAWSNSFNNHESCSLTPWWKSILPSNAEITRLRNGSLRQRRRCPIMDPVPFEFQFPCEARRSYVVRTEESFIGPTTMTKLDLGGSV